MLRTAMRAWSKRWRFQEEGIHPRILVSVFLCLLLVPAFAGTALEEESGQVWLRCPFRTMSGAAPSPFSADPSKPALRNAQPEKHLQSKSIFFPSCAQLSWAKPCASRFGEEAGASLLLPSDIHRLPIKRAPPMSKDISPPITIR
jgi:hypothetical protein